MTAHALVPHPGAAKARPRFKLHTGKAPTADEFAERLRQVRVQRGLTTTEAAELLGIAKQTLSQWEAGDCHPEHKHLLRFLEVMRIDAGELFRGLSAELEPLGIERHGRRAANRLVPLHTMSTAGAILMGEAETAKDHDSFVSTNRRHAPGSVAFTVRGKSLEPKFFDGDIITVAPLLEGQLPDPGRVVLANIKERKLPLVLRRFMPQVEGELIGTRLKAFDHAPDIIFADGDVILGCVVEHTSFRN